MKRIFSLLLTVAVLSACMTSPTPTPTSPTETAVPPTPTPQGRTLIVTSPADSGPGTLRRAMEEAQTGDTIAFDPSVFPPDASVTIFTTSELPHIRQGNLTIDASNAGVVLDGSDVAGDWLACLQIVSSNGNTIRGLQISNFSGPGIAISGDAQYNTIGGDRSIGAGPFGQGNLLSSNDVGIVLSTNGTSLNTVTGNLIGTNAESADGLGNHKNGVWITEGANNNTIGPGNVIAHNADIGVLIADGAHNNTVGPGNIIAYNNRSGILVDDPETVRNTITQNSIHNNIGRDIELFEGGNTELSIPQIFDFDLQAGTIAGLACAKCTVEIFSDSSYGGKIYEGQAIADGAGTFAFNRGIAFTGPHLTATTTDAAGNTSTFSPPTLGPNLSFSLQAGYDLRKTWIVPKSFGELADNHMGDTFPLDRHPIPCPPASGDWSFTHVGELGLKWVRLSLDTIELEPVWSTGNYSQFEINQCQDEIVTLLSENDITILYTLVYWDKNLHAENYPNYKNEEEIQLFLDYTRLIVRHFKGRIQYYEILNEPVHYAEVTDYINLILRAIPVIRAEDPEAKIVVGGSTDLMYDYPREYLFDVLQSDIMPLVDGIATHPMYGVSPQYEETRQYYDDYPSLIQQIKDVASANGFRGEYFAEEMDWRTSINPSPYQPGVYTPIVAAKYYARGILINRGLDFWAGIGVGLTIPPIWRAIQNLSTTMAGARPDGLTARIETEAENITSYGFSLPNGDRLFAVWNDNVAVDYDPGVPSTLTFPGSSAQKVIGIDVLHGFEQELIVEMENGNLIIRDFLIKDYPIILRLVE